MDSKVCRKCKLVKKIESFHKNRNYADGYTTWCKACATEAAKKSYEKNKETPSGSRFILSNTSLEDYCEMWDFLSKIGYDIHGNIHEQFCEKHNLKKKKKRSVKSDNRFTIDQCIKKDPII